MKVYEISEFRPTQVVSRWFDTGALGPTLVFGEVVRVNRVTVTVRWENGRTWRISPDDLDILKGDFAEEIRLQYLKPPIPA